jgi:hypothetical protein
MASSEEPEIEAGFSMVEEDDEKARLIAHLRFISGQVNMLMDLCVTFISSNSDPERLAQRFEATVKSTLAHTDLKLIAQEYLDGELDIVNRVRLDVMSALPRRAFQREELSVLLTSSTITANTDEAAPGKSIASHALEALTVEWVERASELERNRLVSLSTTPPNAD